MDHNCIKKDFVAKPQAFLMPKLSASLSNAICKKKYFCEYIKLSFRRKYTRSNCRCLRLNQLVDVDKVSIFFCSV